MIRKLIVNADDCNLTPGVNRAILDCHDRGIVTSTTIFVNLLFNRTDISALLKRKKLGLGIHLNITFGSPVSKPSAVKSLLNPKGAFLRPEEYLRRRPRVEEILTEYESQVKRFRKIFGKNPTHLDTHHQVHDRPLFYQASVELARAYRIPLRRSCLMDKERRRRMTGVKITDHLFGSLDPKKCWTKNKLRKTLMNLPAGISEIFCHPGENDVALRAVSSLTAGRQKEAALFSSGAAKNWICAEGIRLIHYGML